MTRAALLALALTGAAAAQEPPPETSPEPVQRPVENPEPTAPASTEDAPVTGDAPLEPVQRPAEDPEPTAPPTSEDAPGPVAAGKGTRDLVVATEEEHAECLAALDALGAVYEPVPAVTPEDDPDCGILRPLSVEAVLPDVSLAPASVLRCPTAVALGRWVRDFVNPAAERADRGALTAIEGGSGYTCRRRNNQPDGRLSEHAFGNAYDVTGFRFSEGDTIPIRPRAREGSIEESFQDAVRAAACLEFTTVIGPGSDAYHDDHLHLDVVARPSGFRLCEQGTDESR
jgi:hypothetical protein